MIQHLIAHHSKQVTPQLVTIFFNFFLPAPTLQPLFLKTLRTYNLRKIVVSLCIFHCQSETPKFWQHTSLLGTHFTVYQFNAHYHTRDICHSMPVTSTLAYQGHISQQACYKHTILLGTYFTVSQLQEHKHTRDIFHSKPTLAYSGVRILRIRDV